MNKKVLIKHTDLQIAPLNFGGNVFGWTLDEAESFKILDAFVDSGFNFIDTANTYAWWVNGTGGQSETIIGKWIKQRKNRDQLVVATKVGSETKEHPVDSSKKHILKSVDESLSRLQSDYIDIYYTHFDDGVSPVEETLQAYDELLKAGKVRYIAASNISPERLRESLEASKKNGLPSYIALQPHYNLLVREDFEKKYAPLVTEFDLSVFTYWSLAAGFLTGKYQKEEDFDKTARGASIKKYYDARGKAVLAALGDVAKKHASSPASVALAWLLANPLVTAPIASATSQSQLQTLIDAVSLELSSEDIAVLNQAGQY